MANFNVKSLSFWLFAAFAWVLLLSASSSNTALAAPIAAPGGAGKIVAEGVESVAKKSGKQALPVLEADFRKLCKPGTFDKKTKLLKPDQSFFFTGTTGGASEVNDLKKWAVDHELTHVTNILKPGMDKPKRYEIPAGAVVKDVEDKFWNDLSGSYTKWSNGKAYVAIPGGKDGIANVNKNSIFYKTELAEMQKAENKITHLFVMDSKKMPNSLDDVKDEWPLQKQAASSSSGGVGSAVEDGVDKITGSLSKII